jgi:hypothetical protein
MPKIQLNQFVDFVTALGRRLDALFGQQVVQIAVNLFAHRTQVFFD